MINFSYNGEKLSDYGCIVAGINTDYQNSVQIGVPIQFDTIKTRQNYTNKIINAKYDDVITATFDICKNPCLYKTQQEMSFSDGEISHFMRWLNQKHYYKFKPIYKNGMYSDLYFYGTFTSVSTIVWNGYVIGFTLTFTSNSPFGYVDDKEFTVSLNPAQKQFLFFDDSDEIGSLYPYFFQVECLSNGKLLIENDRDTKNTVIDNCIQNELITLDCANKVIQSSKPHPTLYNDFNYNYPRFINDLNNRRNLFTVSIPCNITIKYAPIRKAGIIV
ncbi:MAG: hypothetical protein HFH82_01055 [Lachnospiraceae bacterium]|nr:hypothetical protein [Lachnospiraceae bacterium]